ncbi:MAG: hypothetical protein JSU88_09190 [Nitrospinaceae bacterium]|jgi:hypothetical protein|nr:MAG: hypothetical protein JSU88_09190 [Nitrospinaceae bacterium]
MLKVECHSGYKLNEKPVAFKLIDRKYKVEDIIDRWYGEGANYFKVRADDGNIYLLKYDGCNDHWDLVFYQNPKKIGALPGCATGFNPHGYSLSGFREADDLSPLN